MVYPAKDARVIRVVKKIVRGLSHFHGIMSAVPEDLVWVNIMEYIVPDVLLRQMSYSHREQDIAEYQYVRIEEKGIHSAWLITFFNTVQFIGLVSTLGNGMIQNAENGYK